MSGQLFDCPGYELDGNARIRGLVLPAFLIIIICRLRCLIKLLSTVVYRSGDFNFRLDRTVLKNYRNLRSDAN